MTGAVLTGGISLLFGGSRSTGKISALYERNVPATEKKVTKRLEEEWGVSAVGGDAAAPAPPQHDGPTYARAANPALRALQLAARVHHPNADRDGDRDGHATTDGHGHQDADADACPTQHLQHRRPDDQRGHAAERALHRRRRRLRRFQPGGDGHLRQPDAGARRQPGTGWHNGNRTLTITPAANQNGSATITVRATDPGGLFAEDTFTLTVTAVNDAPVLTAGGTLAYTENQAATAIDATVTVTDVDSTNLVGATVQITGNYGNGQDVLSYVTALGISGTFNATTGTLTLTGTTTVANYQTALRNVLYANTSNDPSVLARTVTWQVNDGGAANNLSNTPTSTINVAAVNDPPTAIGRTNLPAQASIPITYPAARWAGRTSKWVRRSPSSQRRTAPPVGASPSTPTVASPSRHCPTRPAAVRRSRTTSPTTAIPLLSIHALQLCIQAQLSGHRDDLAAARACAERVVQQPEQPALYRVEAFSALVHYHLLRGDAASAARTLERMDAAATGDTSPVYWSQVVLRAQQRQQAGDLTQAPACYRGLLERIGERAVYTRQQAWLGLAAIALERNRLDEAAAHLQRIELAERLAGRTYRTIEVAAPLLGARCCGQADSLGPRARRCTRQTTWLTGARVCHGNVWRTPRPPGARCWTAACLRPSTGPRSSIAPTSTRMRVSRRR